MSPRKPAASPAARRRDAGRAQPPPVAAPGPAPIEVDAGAQPPLGMPAAEFLRDYWQKKPLLIRNAFPGFVSPISPEDLAGLACEEAALSRIVAHQPEGDRWLVQHGPFPEDLFPGLPQHDWTLLVQDVDKWDADVAALLPAFGFLPRWRIDDVMVSFAAPGGSVGAHVDQYDVFLLQVQGRRRWAIDAGEAPPSAFRDDVELRLLREFHPTHAWVLEPGDMLYLPPGVPHHGVAEDACLTFSIGMRAPSAAELLGDYVDTLAAEADESQRYRDPDLAPPADPNEIDAAAMARVVAALNLLRMNDPDRLGDWFGRFISAYRSPGAIAPAPQPPSRIEFDWALAHGGSLQRHPFARAAWRRARRQARLYADGRDHALPVADARRLAAAATLDGRGYAALSPAGRDLAFALLESGHYLLRMPGEADAGPQGPPGPDPEEEPT
jgi:50S ribosomal protein L16 3-hydroxylase